MIILVAGAWVKLHGFYQHLKATIVCKNVYHTSEYIKDQIFELRTERYEDMIDHRSYNMTAMINYVLIPYHFGHINCVNV